MNLNKVKVLVFEIEMLWRITRDTSRVQKPAGFCSPTEGDSEIIPHAPWII